MKPRWDDHARARLAEHGHRAGGAREAVIDVLAREGGCLAAHEIAESLRGSGRRAGTASIYRALALLTELRVLRGRDVGEGVVRYELVVPGGDHHHHVVCDRCGATEAFEDGPLEEAIESLARAHAWTVEDHDVVLHGRCPRCARP